MAVVTITTPGAGTWTVPAGIASITVRCWGGGGHGGAGDGGNNGGGGGGGGAYSESTLSVTPSDVIDYYVGAGGATAEANGEDTTFGDLLEIVAQGGYAEVGGTAGIGGAAASGSGDTKYSGGDGATGESTGGSNDSRGGGGGGSAGSGGDGGNGAVTAGGAAGSGTYPGAAGGNGGAPGVNGVAGASPGAGGGGGGTYDGSVSGQGAAGANGRIEIQYGSDMPCGTTTVYLAGHRLTGDAAMRDLGDRTAGSTIDFKFNTYSSSGAGFTLAGTPSIAVYKSNGTTEDTSGITLTVDFDAKTGVHHVTIDLSSDATFYSAGSDFDVVLAAGTVDGVSVAGSVLAHFTVEKLSALRPTTAGRTLDVTATGAAGIDWANIEGKTTTNDLSGTTVSAAQSVAAVTVAAGGITRAALAADTGLQTVRSNTAQAGASTTITLDASASATTDLYKHCLIFLTGGTGAGQYRLCTAYNGTTKVATVTPAWATNPDNTSTFAALPAGLVNAEALGGTAIGTATVAATLSSSERNSIADALLDRTDGVETNRTLRQSLRLMLAAAAGKLSGVLSGSILIRDTNDTKNRITATTTTDGRTAVTYDAN